MSDRLRAPLSLAALLDGLVDYAGLFPPAGLDMQEAVRRFAQYRSSPDAWALGRFVVPASRLDEFVRELASLPAMRSPRPWPLSVLISVGADLQRVQEFAERLPADGDQPTVRVEAIEAKAATVEELERSAREAPTGIELFFELPGGDSVDDLCRAAAACGRGVKIRTGGTSPDAFPPSAAVARFLASCAAAQVPFKATAGLHHPVRSAHPVNGAGSPTATMHGFLNVFVAAALLVTGEADIAVATQVLEDEVPGAFRFDDDGLAWRDHRLDVARIGAARWLARSFGSCSFDEPLHVLGTDFAKATGRVT